VTFHVYVPSGAPLTSVQPYVLQGAGGGWAWTGNWQPGSALHAGQWNTLSVTVPSNAALPLAELGFELTTSASWTGSLYLDAVSW
jgi:hypothetical protein